MQVEDEGRLSEGRSVENTRAENASLTIRFGWRTEATKAWWCRGLKRLLKLRGRGPFMQGLVPELACPA